MSEENSSGSTGDETRGKTRGGSLQTKALAGLVAVMLAAAIVALVFVTGGNNGSDQQAGAAQPTSSNVGKASNTPTVQPTTPSASSTASSSTATTNTAAPSTTASSPATRSSTATSKPAGNSASSSRHSTDGKKVVYTVKKGDTLSDIGAWYSLHGYLKLYDWNKSVIGKNPDLIFPGQRIIVSDGKVGVAQH